MFSSYLYIKTLHHISATLHPHDADNPNGGLAGSWRRRRSCSLLLLSLRRSVAEKVEQLTAASKSWRCKLWGGAGGAGGGGCGGAQEEKN